VTNYFKIKTRLCDLGFIKEMGIPFVQQVDLREAMNKIHGTSSILAFLNHLSPFNGSHAALVMKSSVISNSTSPTLALKSSKVCAKAYATWRL
jgi:hypothetical protein